MRRVKHKSAEVASLLQAEILNGGLKLGERLVELQLARKYKVSQGAVREALQQLERLGLVVKYPDYGSYVVNLESVDLIHIYQVRRELEPLTCALAAVSLKQSTLDLLEERVAQMRETAAKRDHEGYMTADLSFHRVIWQSQPNPLLEKILTATCLPLFAYELVQRKNKADLNFDPAVKQHEMILASIRSGDPVLVAKFIRRTIDRFLRQDIAVYSPTSGTPKTPGADEDVQDTFENRFCCLQ